MPALQALAAVPSFGGQLGQALGGGISQGISSSINQMLQQKQQQQSGSALAEYFGKPHMAKSLGSLPLDIQKEVAKSYFKQQQQNQLDQDIVQGSFDRLAELSDKIGYSALPVGWHGDESAGDRAEFESQKASLISALRDKVNKGVLTNQKFQYIVKELLPSHGERSVIKKRKLKGIGEQLGLNTSAVSKNKPNQNDFILMKDPSGKLRNVPKDDAIAAQKEGYKLQK